MPLDHGPATTNKTKLYIYNPAKDPKEVPTETDVADLQQSVNSGSMNNIQEEQNRSVIKKYTTVKEKIETISSLENDLPKIELSKKDKEILRKLELEHENKIRSENMLQNNVPESNTRESVINVKEDIGMSPEKPQTKPSVRPRQTVSFIAFSNILFSMYIKQLIFIPKLSPTAKAQEVPATRLQRMVSFGTLGIGLGVGTVAEYTRRTLGLKKQSLGDTFDNMFLTKANAERIVSTLCKVRGEY